MFLDPHEAMNNYYSVDSGGLPGSAEIHGMWQDKLRESQEEPKFTEVWESGQVYTSPHGAGVYDAMADGKIDTPVTVYQRDWRGQDLPPTMGNGHHRVASAAALGRLVPVNHSYYAAPVPIPWNKP